jgi:hypothetical protein
LEAIFAANRATRFHFPVMRTNRSLAGRDNLSIGGLTFGPGNADTLMFGSQEAAIQYNSGAFNGFFYISDFMFQGNPYELSLSGRNSRHLSDRERLSRIQQPG